MSRTPNFEGNFHLFNIVDKEEYGSNIFFKNYIASNFIKIGDSDFGTNYVPSLKLKN